MARAFHRILIATDLEEASRGALERALAIGAGGSVVVLHVLTRTHEEGHWRSTLFAEDLVRYHGLLQEEEVDARNRLRAQIADVSRGAFRGNDPEIIVRGGRPAETIAAVAREVGADLVVVGTHGRQGTISSVAERVARSASGPVLIVPWATAAGGEGRLRIA